MRLELTFVGRLALKTTGFVRFLTKSLPQTTGVGYTEVRQPLSVDRVTPLAVREGTTGLTTKGFSPSGFRGQVRCLAVCTVSKAVAVAPAVWGFEDAAGLL